MPQPASSHMPQDARKEALSKHTFRIAMHALKQLHIYLLFLESQSALTPTACYAASTNPWTETI